MIVAIQQPEHAPWIGFFHKMAHCDLFVYLDSVQFKRRYFENRNRIRTVQGSTWLTVPVQSKGRYSQRIDQVQIDENRDWIRKYRATLEQAYRRSPFWAHLRDIVWPCLEHCPTALVSLNIVLIESVRSYLGIEVETIRSSMLALDSFSGSDLILAISQKVGAEAYISGPDGRDYLDARSFRAKGLDLVYHDYEHPVYPQRGAGFISHMSIFDLIANCGPESSAIVREGIGVEVR